MTMTMKTWHGEVETYPQAHEIAEAVVEEVRAWGGAVTVGRALDGPNLLMLVLPDNVAPSDLVPSVRWYEVHAMRVPQVPDQGITE